MNNTDMTQKLSKGPKTRVCYICGRQYGLTSFDIHVKQCKELWVAREELRPPKERKKLPEDPLLQLQSTAGSASSDNTQFSPMGSPSGQSKGATLSLDEVNALAQSTFNNVAMEKCGFCGRTFLAEKLVIHNR